MYIKIKHIKQFLLISACLFFAGFNYFSYVKADDAKIGDQKNCDKAIDTDCDGLTNTEEALYGTNPNNADTDGDGYSDGVEVKSGYDPTKPAPGDRTTSINTRIQADSQGKSTENSMTNNFIQDFQQFLSSKDNQSISISDINSFTDNELSGKIIPTTFNNLPEIDNSKIKIIDQTYNTLSPADKKQKRLEDSVQYLYKIGYILAANAPTTLTTSADFNNFKDDFELRITNIQDPSNLAYFSDLGDRIQVFSEQLSDVPVPSSMVDLHIKFSRLVKGFVALKTSPDATMSDPMGKIILLSRAQDLTLLFANFLDYDLSDYFKQISAS